jgi:PST family polysaccharide transporter
MGQLIPESEGPAEPEIKDIRFRTDHLKENLGGRAARGSIITFGWHTLRFSVGIVATAIMARLVSPKDYGLIGMVAVFTSFISMFKDMGLSLATVQKAEINDAEISTLFWLNLGLSFLIAAGTSVLAPLIAWFYGEPQLLLITIVTSLGFIVGGVAVQHEALLKRQMRFFALGFIGFFALVAGYAVGIAMAWRGYGYWALVGSQLALISTNTIGVWAICRWYPSRPQRNSGIRSMLTFGRNLTGYAMINVFAKNLDGLLVGRVWGAQQLGLYTKAGQVLAMPTDQINEPLNAVAIPALSRLDDSPERYRQGYLRILEKIVMITMPGIALMIVTADWVVYLLLGPQWNDAAFILVLLGIAGLTQPVVNSLGWLLITQGRTHHMFQWALISAPLGIASIVVGLPWGAPGVAASYAIVRVCITDRLMYWFVGRSGPVRTMDLYRTMVPAFCAASSVAVAVLIFRNLAGVVKPMTGMAISVLIAIIVSLGVLVLIPSGRRALQDLSNSLLTFRRTQGSPAGL